MARKMKTNRQNTKGDVGRKARESTSERTRKRSEGLFPVVIALTSVWESVLRQILVRLREEAWIRASLTASASAIIADETWDWALDPLVSSRPALSVKIHHNPAGFVSDFHAASVLQKVIGNSVSASSLWLIGEIGFGRFPGWAASHSFEARIDFKTISCGESVRFSNANRFLADQRFQQI